MQLYHVNYIHNESFRSIDLKVRRVVIQIHGDKSRLKFNPVGDKVYNVCIQKDSLCNEILEISDLLYLYRTQDLISSGE